MSREIKFRAWDKEWNVMYASCLPVPVGTEWNYTLKDGMPSTLLEMSDRYEFMQYTGLKDKNGKDIYEGDIVEGEFGRDTIELREMHLEGGGTATCYMYSLSPLSEGLVDEVGIKVIGNIYENGDLLK